MTARNTHSPTRAGAQRGTSASLAAADCGSHDFVDSFRTRISQTTMPAASAV
jgi:hypothetical protein